MATDKTDDAGAQRDALLESERQAHAQQPGSFKEEALTEKTVRVEPDGTGPSSTKTLDTPSDQQQGSGNKT